eukprot:TRINITY_DN21802_c1_g1_i1.p1 TRINITY_DN21802_c1_g1~~TRINITY_DN21802_c1_g1_i1.p1  ORF type:complete len:225 (+),score=18.83 TRINITY_DN21802_c1_g1_i1:243-917(+)
MDEYMDVDAMVDAAQEDEVIPTVEDDVVMFSEIIDQQQATGVDETPESDIRISWVRPSVPQFDPNRDPLVFQQLEIDYAYGGIIQELRNNREDDDIEGAIIRIYGVTQHGNSVCVFVHGFRPYFYIQVHPEYGVDDATRLKQNLNARLQQDGKLWKSKTGVLSCDIESKCSIWRYQKSDKQKFVKVTLASPALVTPAKMTSFIVNQLRKYIVEFFGQLSNFNVF